MFLRGSNSGFYRDKGDAVFGDDVWMTHEGDFIEVHCKHNTHLTVDSKFMKASHAQASLLNPSKALALVSPLAQWRMTAKAVTSCLAFMGDPCANACALYVVGESDEDKAHDERIKNRLDIVRVVMSDDFLPVRIFRTRQEAVEWARAFAPPKNAPVRPDLVRMHLVVTKDLVIEQAEADVPFICTADFCEDMSRQILEISEETSYGRVFPRIYDARHCISITPQVLAGRWDKSALKSSRKGPMAIVVSDGPMMMVAYFLGKFFPNRQLRFFKTVEAAREWCRFLAVNLNADGSSAAVDLSHPSA